jgi:sugar lactone lactonase YvrE
MPLEFTCVADIKGRIAEGPVYDERTDRLYFVDILNRVVYGVDVATDERASWTFESEVGSIGLAASGALVVALRHSVVLFDPESGRRADLCSIEESEGTRTRLNDGRVGPDGAFWVGSMDDRPEKEPIGALYRVDPTGKVERKVERVVISNGLAWTADGETMFHADTRGPWIDRWRFDRATGAISERTRFAAPDEVGRPDGGSCDAEGFYWSAGVTGGRLNRFAPDGSLAESFEVPVPTPTMVCFGGRDFRTIYVTSLTENRDPAMFANAKCAGGLLAAKAPVAGFPSWRFLDI